MYLQIENVARINKETLNMFYRKIHKTFLTTTAVCDYDKTRIAQRIVSFSNNSTKHNNVDILQYLHENEVIHRDLKPENLLYEDSTDDARLKLADFGLSKIIDSELQTQTVCGTPGYCCPEVLKGRKYGSAVDMWSIGVITYILLCGYEPFYSDNEAEMFKKIMKCDYVFDSPWWDDVTDNAKDLISKLLVLDSSKRLTAVEALQHPWVKGNAACSNHMEDAQTKLKQFNARRKLKAATDVLMAFSFKSLGSLHNRTDNDSAAAEKPSTTQSAAAVTD